MRPRYLKGYGLVERGLNGCVERLAGAEIAERSVLEPRGWGSREEAIAYLSHLTFPATRLVLLVVNDRWTAVLTNSRNGSDFDDHQLFFGRLCAARTCRVVEGEPRRGMANGYAFRQGYASRIFVLRDQDGRNVRSIYAVDDGGRWDFAAYGDAPLPVEADFDYGAERKSDRFTSENLQVVLASLGLEPTVHEAFERADRLWLVYERMKHEPWARHLEAGACTPEQADDPGFWALELGLGYAKHMDTHASAVVRNLTRAVLYNPALAERAEPPLRAARRKLGDLEFERLAAETEADLRHG